jgi:hypothetical protein
VFRGEEGEEIGMNKSMIKLIDRLRRMNERERERERERESDLVPTCVDG